MVPDQVSMGLGEYRNSVFDKIIANLQGRVRWRVKGFRINIAVTRFINVYYILYYLSSKKWLLPT